VLRALPELAADLRMPELVESALFHAVLLWMGPARSITQLHHDFTDNLFAMVRGRKRVFLLPPEQDVHRFPLPRRGGRSSWHLSRAGTCVDPDAELHRAIGDGDVAPLEVVVGPGDMLLIPAFWWHEVHSIDDPSISLAYWWDQRSEAEIQATLQAVSSFAEAYEALPPRWKRLLKGVIGRELFHDG
jgi:hypothetical protein